jgi:hypothetical protein
MKYAWMVLTISIEMKSETGTMFWNAMRQELWECQGSTHAATEAGLTQRLQARSIWWSL